MDRDRTEAQPTVEVRFSDDLDVFVSLERRGRPTQVALAHGTTVKDLAESLGVPHTEIEVITVNGTSVGFAHRLRADDRVEVYGTPDAPALSPVVHLRPRPPGRPRFLLDVHLGRLARWLRLLGFDARWGHDLGDDELVALAEHEGRILLSRDRGLLKRRAVAHGSYVRESLRRRQLTEVLTRFDLFDEIEPFGRCLECNGVLAPVAKQDVDELLPPRTRLEYQDFRQCGECRRVYWQGSHYDHLRSLVEEVEAEHRARLAAEEDPAARGPAARSDCALGWSVVPLYDVANGRCSCGDAACAAPGKHPRVAWERFMFERATAELVASWWRRWPRANVGVVTGAVSGLAVLDVDPRHGGEDTLEGLEELHTALPPTVESLTGGGGRHLYFRHPGTRVPSGPLAAGLDVKGEGGLVVAPPSVHASGGGYRWAAGRGPGSTALAELPEWLLAMMLARGRPAAASHHRREAAPRTEGERREFAELWSEAGVEVQPGDHTYLCPFHEDHHPSLHIDAEGCRFYCFGCARGGGAGLLRKLLVGWGTAHGLDTGDDDEPAPVTAPAPATGLTLAGAEEVRVVGESACQDTLLELAGGRRRYGGARRSTVARLVPEPRNPADPAAIAVTIAGRLVGYLSRADAARHHDAVVAAIERSGEASCAATIVGGWAREHGDTGFFGVRLLL